MKKSPVLATLVLAVCSLVTAAQVNSADTDSTVPELVAFHGVIAPIWHEAYPAKDCAALRRFVPEINQLFAKLEAAQLPGILRGKQDAWKERLAEFKRGVEAYNRAAAGTDDQALLEAAEALHGCYERMVRLIRPVTKEIDSFHKVLYVVYHGYLPERQFNRIKEAAAELKLKAVAIEQAKLPEWRQDKTAEYQKEAQALLAEVAKLEVACQSGDAAAIEKAVEAVHGAYVDLEGVF